jgi:hypothetical protein
MNVTMAEIVRFRKKRSEKEEAVHRLALKLVAEFSMMLYELDCLRNIPVQSYVRTIEQSMCGDGFDYGIAEIECLINDPAHMARAREMFRDALHRYGIDPSKTR